MSSAMRGSWQARSLPVDRLLEAIRSRRSWGLCMSLVDRVIWMARLRGGRVATKVEHVLQLLELRIVMAMVTSLSIFTDVDRVAWRWE